MCGRDVSLAILQFFYEWNDQADGHGQWFRSYGLEVMHSASSCLAVI
jgi:nuclear transport factor 2 (NTF2) superfamily protein